MVWNEVFDKSADLRRACAIGNVRGVIDLIDDGADVNQPDRFGHVPLRHACRKGHLNVVKILVSKGANLFSKFKGKSLLYNACEDDSDKVARYLISQGLSPLEKDKDGATIVRYCVVSGRVKCVKLFIELGISFIEEEGLIKQSPLHRVCTKKQGLHGQLERRIECIGLILDSLDEIPKKILANKHKFIEPIRNLIEEWQPPPITKGVYIDE